MHCAPVWDIFDRHPGPSSRPDEPALRSPAVHQHVLYWNEADRMLDMGFIHDVKKIIAKLPSKRQTLFFLRPPCRGEISKLADTILTNPVRVASDPRFPLQPILLFNPSILLKSQNKRSLLLHLLKQQSIETALVFTRTKHGADKVAKDLNRAGVQAEAIHGNKFAKRTGSAPLSNFKAKQTRVLVANRTLPPVGLISMTCRMS